MIKKLATKFEVGKKYQNGSDFVHTCVGYTTKGIAIFESSNGTLYANKNYHFYEYREPREIFVIAGDQCSSQWIYYKSKKRAENALKDLKSKFPSTNWELICYKEVG